MTSVLLALAIRSVPFALYGIAGSELSSRTRCVLFTLLALVLLVANGLGPATDVLSALVLAVGYLAAVSTALHALCDRRVLRHSAAVFIACAAAYVVVPAMTAPVSHVPACVGIGWVSMLSAYSYWSCTQRQEDQPSLRDCLFFILVNPTLTYSERGRRERPPKLTTSAVIRVVTGVAFWIAQDIWFARVVLPWALSAPGAMFGGSTLRDFVEAVGYYAAAAIGMYLAHTGLASVQIGLVRLYGWRVPECYRKPFLATSPLDFWRRWNIWVRTWAVRHVFIPFARNRLRTGANRTYVRVAGVILTFVVVGLLHDLALSAMRPWNPFRHVLPATKMFFAFALIVLVWELLALPLRRIANHQATKQASFSRVRAVVGWLCFVPIACFMQSLAMPVLSSRGFPSIWTAILVRLSVLIGGL